ncbi:MAG TPA: hypothetical protein DCM49_03405 [Lachnospiraceae bacterium]|nr:hypothetical protein [Lachnospiraceae bacterium]
MSKDYTVAELISMVQAFCEARDWDQFHNPKDLAIGVSTEANELLDIFRFRNGVEVEDLMNDARKRKHVEEELADILFFVLRFAQMNRIDLKEILERKMAKNAEKYPVKYAKGRNLKYDELAEYRNGTGDVDKFRNGTGDGDKFRNGTGDGDEFRNGTGDGDEFRRNEGLRGGDEHRSNVNPQDGSAGCAGDHLNSEEADHSAGYHKESDHSEVDRAEMNRGDAHYTEAGQSEVDRAGMNRGDAHYTEAGQSEVYRTGINRGDSHCTEAGHGGKNQSEANQSGTIQSEINQRETNQGEINHGGIIGKGMSADVKRASVPGFIGDIKRRFLAARTQENLLTLLSALRISDMYVPVKDFVKNEDGTVSEDWEREDTGEILLKVDIMEDEEGERYFPVFSSKEEIPEDYKEKQQIISLPMTKCIRMAKEREDLAGIVIDPFTDMVTMPPQITDIILEMESHLPLEE